MEELVPPRLGLLAQVSPSHQASRLNFSHQKSILVVEAFGKAGEVKFPKRRISNGY